MSNLPASTLTKNQTKTFGPRAIPSWDKGAMITATVRYDDQCGNGHNTLSITAEITTPSSRRRNDCDTCGCLHNEIARIFPSLIAAIPFHLVSSDGPMHYVANSVYHVKQGKLDYARSAAVWPDATDEDLRLEGLEERLNARLPQIMEDFKTIVESFGFTY